MQQIPISKLKPRSISDVLHIAYLCTASDIKDKWIYNSHFVTSTVLALCICCFGIIYLFNNFIFLLFFFLNLVTFNSSKLNWVDLKV